MTETTSPVAPETPAEQMREAAARVAEEVMRRHAKAHYSGEVVRVFKHGDDQLCESAAKAYCAGEILEAIRALPLPPEPALTVKVKPLVWKWHRDPKDTSEARTQIGSWTVWEINGSAYCYGPDDTCGKPCGTTLESAKAAAQADYEARILSALDGGAE